MEETTNTVKSSSNGSVKIALEEYQSLLARAAEKPPIVHNTVHKTPAIQASDNMMFGGVLMGFGGMLFIIGGIVFVVGRNQAKSLKS